MQTVFVHGYLMVAAPMVYLSIGLLLLNGSPFPQGFAYVALGLAAAFEVLGFIGLFQSMADSIAIVPLIAEALWILSASVVVLRFRRARPGAGVLARVVTVDQIDFRSPPSMM